MTISVFSTWAILVLIVIVGFIGIIAAINQPKDIQNLHPPLTTALTFLIVAAMLCSVVILVSMQLA